jgi:hypothetical protein
VKGLWPALAGPANEVQLTGFVCQSPHAAVVRGDCITGGLSLTGASTEAESLQTRASRHGRSWRRHPYASRTWSSAAPRKTREAPRTA